MSVNTCASSMTACAKHLAIIVGAALIAGISPAVMSAEPSPVASDRDHGFFGGTRDEVLAQCKRVGLIRLAGPAFPGAEPGATDRLEAAAMRSLQLAGLEVEGPASYWSAYERLNKAAGGIFDPMTGAARSGVAKEVYQGAVKEFFAQEQLGCVATLRVVLVTANDHANLATWDGAVETVDGQAPRTYLRILAERGVGDGKVSAISALLQLYDRDQKVLFGRRGGVQLTAYYDPRLRAQNIGVLAVPRAKLLQDDKRIERALDFATAPLRYSSQQLAAEDRNPAVNTLLISPASLPAPPAGSSLNPEPALRLPREQIINSVHRVVLGQLLLNGFNPPAEVALRYQSLIHERLAKLGWDVIDSDSLNLDANDAVHIVGGVYDPFTGKSDADKLRQSNEVLIKRLSLRAPPDAIVFIALVKVTAAQKLGNAVWDGAEQNAQNLGAAIHHSKLFGGTELTAAGEATISAMSLHVWMRDAAGVVLYDKHGGIELLQQMSLTTRPTQVEQRFTNLAPADLFKDPQRDVRAVDFALSELLNPSEEEAAKLKVAKH
jgi:hypothetical protein